MLSTIFSATSIFFLAVTLLFTSVEASPLPGTPEVGERDIEARGVSLLSTTDISSFTSFTQFARAAYCQQSKVKTWSCGRKFSLFLFSIVIDVLKVEGGLTIRPFAEACSALPGFQPTLTGGDGNSVPLCGYLKRLHAV